MWKYVSIDYRSSFDRKSLLVPAILFSVLLFHIILTVLGRKRVSSHSWQHRRFSRKQELSSDQERLLCRSKSLLASIQKELPLEKEMWIKAVSFIQNLSKPSTLQTCLPRIFFFFSSLLSWAPPVMDFKTERHPWDNELDHLCSTQFSGINFFKFCTALVELVSFGVFCWFCFVLVFVFSWLV